MISQRYGHCPKCNSHRIELSPVMFLSCPPQQPATCMDCEHKFLFMEIVEREKPRLGGTMKWISVEDSLPEPNSEFLAYARETPWGAYQIIKCLYQDKFQMKGRKPHYEFFESCNCSGYERDYMIIDHVSHWMPLPEPPEK